MIRSPVKLHWSKGTRSSRAYTPGYATVPRTILIGEAGPSRPARQREARKNSLLQRINISLADGRPREPRGSNDSAEFNALHVGYFAVPLCAMVKVHAGARACACTHTRGRPAGRLAPFASRISACSLTRLVRSLPHAVCIDIGKEKSFPFVAKRGKYDGGDLHNTWSRTAKQRLIYTASDITEGFCY